MLEALARRVAATVLAATFLLPATAAERSAAELMDVLMWNREPVGGPFALVDHTGAPRTDADFQSKLMLVYFGFTYCPDVCPTDLQAMALAVEGLGPTGEAVQPIFVTLDPERDTPEHLAAYVPLFHPRLVGLTGTPEAIRRAAAAYKVFYDRVQTTKGEYTIDHSGFVYLVGPGGSYLGFFPPGTPSDRMIEVIRTYLSPKQ